MKIEIITEIRKIMSYFKYLVSCFCEDKGPIVDVKLREVEGLGTFRAKKKMCDVRKVSLGMQREYM